MSRCWSAPAFYLRRSSPSFWGRSKTPPVITSATRTIAVWALSSAKEGGDWKAFPDHCRDQKCLGSVTAQYPLAVHWTIAFDGRSDGQVATRNPEGFDFYSDVGQQKITSTGSVPTLGKPSQQFAGFLNGSVDRPLMANSEAILQRPGTLEAGPASSRSCRRIAQTIPPELSAGIELYECRREHREEVVLARQRH